MNLVMIVVHGPGSCMRAPNRLEAGAPQSVNSFPENLEFAEKIHRKHFISIA
jgi:hypothetical protein